MLKKLVNECRFELSITTTGPLLVKSGYAAADGPDMTPVLTRRNGKDEVYLPGSSLKGVFRSHVEKVIRALNEPAVCMPTERMREDRVTSAGGHPVCDTYGRVSCGEKLELRGKKSVGQRPKEGTEVTPAQAYSDSCPACRLFGSTSFAGRVSIGDAYLADGSPKAPWEDRDGVAIDRYTGGAAGTAKFDFRVVSSGVSFSAEVYLRNFEAWQLGALLLVVQDMKDGLVRIGSGRSRGLGAVRGDVKSMRILYLQPLVAAKPAAELWGLGKLLGGDQAYGTKADDLLQLDPEPAVCASGLRHVEKFCGPALDGLQQKAVRAFVDKVQTWQVPPEMQWAHIEGQMDRGGKA